MLVLYRYGLMLIIDFPFSLKYLGIDMIMLR
jgi:hypothetical protein